MKHIIEVYLDDGRTYRYAVDGDDKAREHCAAIVAGGYRHNDGKVFEHYPPHRVLKVKTDALPTKYLDTAGGT